jgi:hypothetical protein
MDLSINTKTITNFLHRYHVVLFAVIILGGLVFMVLSLNNIIVASSEAGADYTPAGTTFSFDEKTIERINDLRSRDQAASQLDLSNGRTNPFVE